MATPVGMDQTWRFGVYEVDTRRVELRRSGTPVKMREQSFLILVYLLQHAGEIVTREELRQVLWPLDTFVDFDHSLNVAIMNLRDALGDSIEKPVYIETVPRRGYRFIAPVTRAEEETRNGLSHPNGDSDSPLINGTNGAQQAVPASAETPTRHHHRGLISAVTGLIFAAGLLSSAIWYLHRPLPPPRVTGYTQITHDGRKKSLAGTDGSRLYFNEMPGEASIGSIAQIAISGGLTGQIPVALPSPMLADVSPDGANLLVMPVPKEDSVTYPLWNVRILGGSTRRLGEAVVASYSPDANSVAYSTPEGDIWLVQSDGTGAHKLASVGGSVTEIVWSPDGGIIRFSRDNELWEISSSGLAPHKVLPGWPASSDPCCARWTSNGSFFLYLAGDQIWALDERRGLFRRPPAGPIQLTTGPMSWGRPIPGKDGSRIFAEGTIPRGELSRFDSKTKLFQLFLGGISAQGVIFSKDGKSVAYVSYPEGILWKANRDGSNPVQLIDPPMQAGLPRWSPDNMQIVFQSTSPAANKPSTYVVSSEGGSPPKLVSEISELSTWQPDWSPDGRKIIFNAIAGPVVAWVNLKFDIRILDLDSRKVTTVPGSVGILGARWSPDGQYLVAGTKDEVRLMIFDFKTHQWSELAQRGVVDSPEWSRDGKFIYFRRPRGDIGVFRIPVKGGAAEKVVDLKSWHDAGWDGKYMGLDPTDAPLLLRDISSADVYALTLDQK